MSKDKQEMLNEYDLTGKRSVRGKYATRFNKGYSVRIHEEDGTIREQYFAVIEEDIHKHFPDSASINRALRELIS